MPSKERSSDLAVFDVARRNISKFVVTQARMRQERVGFGWRPANPAPSTYEGLVAEFKLCELTGLPLRVNSLDTDVVIYDCPAGNLAFRHWHDTGHVLFNLSFELDDEFELADRHMEALRGEGFGPTTLEHQLLYADTFGQTYFQLCTGRFVGNQVRFDTNCCLFGVEEAVAQELIALNAER